MRYDIDITSTVQSIWRRTVAISVGAGVRGALTEPRGSGLCDPRRIAR
jgi:hypothetical protein